MKNAKKPAPYYKGPVSDHFDGERFYSPWAVRPHKSFLSVIKWRLQGTKREAVANWHENPPKPALLERSESLKVTYIGHATLLIQVGNINLLTDPVFADRASPFANMGPKRLRAPFVPLDRLPKIDFVYVSHNHYDHMDLASLSWLAKHHAPVIYTPLGNTRLIAPVAKNCTMLELDWHQTASLGGDLHLTPTPAQHWSRRTINDVCRDLWAGLYLKKENSASVYFTADTGFHANMFEDIRNRYGAPDIALLPLGAYEPRWFMKYSHMSPDDSIEAFKILGAKRAMGFHFETFQLTDEAYDDPRKRTEELLKAENIKAEDFIIPYPGDFITPA